MRISLRVRVLLTMLIPTAILLVGAFLVFNAINGANERGTSYQADKNAVQAVAQAVTKDRSNVDLDAFQTLVGDDQLTVVYRGHMLFHGPPNTDPGLFTITRYFPGGHAVIVGDVDGTTELSLKLTGIAAALLALVAIAALIGTTTLIRAIREPLERAARVADRLAGGDLDARMGNTGPDQFRRLAKAFDGMASRLQAADRDQAQFLSDLAHEIATPITALIGLAGAALDQTIATRLQREEATQLLEGERTRLRGLLNDLRQHGMLENPDSVDWQTVDIAQLCMGLARLFTPSARGAGLELKVNVMHLDIITAPKLVESIVANFITNAIRYTPEGGVIELKGSSTHDEIVLSVSDTGIGIPAEDRDRVFDRFYRVDSARDRASGGAGLGLAIARRAAIRMGGRIELDSEFGRGSEFRLILPSKPKSSLEPSEPS